MSTDSIKEQFSLFVKAEENETKKINWQKNRDEWLSQLSSLYELISDATTPYNIPIKKKKISIEEERIGVYDADELQLIIGTKIITFIPKGTLLIGAKGRVDVIYGNKIEKLVLIHKSIKVPKDHVQITFGSNPVKKSSKNSSPKSDINDYSWRIFTRDYQYIKLDKVAILQLIMDLING